jgi:hypothetical protein
MPDKRETILAALFTAMKTIVLDPGEEIAFERNRPEPVDQTSLPAVLLFDGDETAPNPDLRPMGRQSVTKLVMNPEIWGYVEAKAADVGTKVNNLRARLIKAIWTNQAFINAVGSMETVTLGPMQTGLGKSKQAIGGFGFEMSITYDFDPRNP